MLAAALLALAVAPRQLAGADSAAFEAWLVERVQTADRAFGAAPCPEARVEVLGWKALGPNETAGPPARRKRVTFLVRARLTGCGRSVIHNVPVTRTGPRSWEGVAVLPGGSRASPRVQTDAMQSVATVALNGAPRLPCTPTQALRSWTNGEAEVVSGGEPGATWRERWPMRMCGQDRTVEVQFSGASAEMRPTIRPAWR